MAGRYVVLEFADRDEAQSFLMNAKMAEQLGYVPIAEYLKPNKFCDCPNKKRQNNSNWKKHKKWGLYICLMCGKPSRHHEQGIFSRLQYVFGFNQIEEK